MTESIEKQIMNDCLNLKNLKSFRLLAPAGSGKTYAIKEILKEFNNKKGIELIQKRKQIAVITFTNLASNEITERVGTSPLFLISTIHSFVWELIKYYPKYIKLLMKKFYIKKIQEQEDKINNPRTRKSEIYKIRLNQYKENSNKLATIKKFIYSPNGDNNQYNSLNHSDVLMLGAEMLKKDGFVKILISRFPILFIDECQDTNKKLMEAFLDLSNNNKKIFCLGLFGDGMQRIYMDGLENINTIHIEKQYDKTKNFRSKKRIIQLINGIRRNADEINQDPNGNVEEGCVRVFITSNSTNRIEFENTVKSKMDRFLHVDNWVEEKNMKILTLEHMMAAKRFKFEAFYEALRRNDSIKMQIQDNRSKELNFLVEKLIFINTLYINKNVIQLKKVILKLNNFFEKNVTQLEQFKKLQKEIDEYCIEYNRCTCLIDLLRLAKRCFPNIQFPDIFDFLLKLSEDEFNLFEVDNDIENENSFQYKAYAWNYALRSPINEAKRCYDYMRQETPYATHQGVKGAGYNNVMAIFDDYSVNGSLFSYEKLFNVKEPSSTDLKHMENNEENTLTRSLRLFYVVCSRAINNLALVIYTEKKDIVKSTLINKFGMDESEIEIN